MSQVAKVLTLLSQAIVSVSTKLSVAAVLGFAALPLLPRSQIPIELGSVLENRHTGQ
jgi:hypothetical protein